MRDNTSMYKKLEQRVGNQLSNYCILFILICGTGWEKNLTYEGKIYFVIAGFVLSGTFIMRILETCRSDKVAELEEEEKRKLYVISTIYGIVIFGGAILNVIGGFIINRG